MGVLIKGSIGRVWFMGFKYGFKHGCLRSGLLDLGCCAIALRFMPQALHRVPLGGIQA